MLVESKLCLLLPAYTRLCCIPLFSFFSTSHGLRVDEEEMQMLNAHTVPERERERAYPVGKILMEADKAHKASYPRRRSRRWRMSLERVMTMRSSG
jgi:hypothetical protein